MASLESPSSVECGIKKIFLFSFIKESYYSYCEKYTEISCFTHMFPIFDKNFRQLCQKFVKIVYNNASEFTENITKKFL